MKKCFNNSALVLGILAILVSVVGMTGCASPGFALTPPLTFQLLPAPKATTIDQLYKDYTTDPVAAEARYTGQRFFFTQVKTETVSKELYPLRGDPYIVAGSVMFKPRYGSDLWPVGEDTGGGICRGSPGPSLGVRRGKGLLG